MYDPSVDHLQPGGVTYTLSRTPSCTNTASDTRSESRRAPHLHPSPTAVSRLVPSRSRARSLNSSRYLAAAVVVYAKDGNDGPFAVPFRASPSESRCTGRTSRVPPSRAEKVKKVSPPKCVRACVEAAAAPCWREPNLEKSHVKRRRRSGGIKQKKKKVNEPNEQKWRSVESRKNDVELLVAVRRFSSAPLCVKIVPQWNQGEPVK